MGEAGGEIGSRIVGGWPVWFEHAGQCQPLRLCALRTSKVATREAQRQAEEKAHDKGQPVRPETLRLAAFVWVLTSLPASWATALVLELYGARWQVELAFKRLKQLLELVRK